jgi:8-oxo-dGTP pyrophosphatase MutT (NUDIX family)|tara:strand:+ start:24 stop:452 length:429 start_codon:yes stop_codon:yes gene_type:complete
MDTEGYREAAGIIVIHIDGNTNDKILLLRRSKNETSKHGLWELPGGKLEKKQTPQEAALQEAHEEAGIEPVIIRTLKPHIDGEMQKIYHGFIGRVRAKTIVVKLSDEHDKYSWMSVKEAMNMTDPLSHHAKFLFEQWKGSNT